MDVNTFLQIKEKPKSRVKNKHFNKSTLIKKITWLVIIQSKAHSNIYTSRNVTYLRTAEGWKNTEDAVKEAIHNTPCVQLCGLVGHG